MRNKYQSFLKSRNLGAAKEEVNKLLAKENKLEVLKEVADAQSSELVFHAFASMKDSLTNPDVASLLEILEKLKNPMIDGEEIAGYIRTKNEIARKIEELTGIHRSEEEKNNPDKLDLFMAAVKKWGVKS